MNDKSIETFKMFYNLASAMYNEDLLRATSAYKMTTAFYRTHGTNNRFEAAFLAESMDFHAVLSHYNHPNTNRNWFDAMKAIKNNYDQRLQEEFS